MTELSRKKCVPCDGSASPMTPEEADVLLEKLNGWIREGSEIKRIYTFLNYYHAMAFVNASAYVSHQEDHHPDLLVGYKTCAVTYTTHAINGLSENDFICAAKLDALFNAP